MGSSIDSGSANLEAMDAAKAYQAAMTRLLVSTLGLPAGLVLDYGAGTGAYTRMAAQARPRWTVHALEPNRALHRHFGSGARAFASLDELLPGSLDAAFSLNVFEHIQDDVRALEHLAACCKPGAPIFLLVPAHMSLWSPMDDLVGHARRYGLSQLEELGLAAGLRVAASGWFDGTGYLATKAYRLAARSGLLTRVDGTITARQVQAFDRVFSVCEPILSALRAPLGKNCWVKLTAV